MSDDTAKWSISERLELVEALGDLKARIIENTVTQKTTHDLVIKIEEDIRNVHQKAEEAKQLAQQSHEKISRLYWLGGIIASLVGLWKALLK